MNDRHKEKLLTYAKNNIYIPGIEDNREFVTCIYSNCFSSHRGGDFIHMGYVLHRVNHLVWFGQGKFHTNSIEGLWSSIKRISNNFAGVNLKFLMS